MVFNDTISRKFSFVLKVFISKSLQFQNVFVTVMEILYLWEIKGLRVRFEDFRKPFSSSCDSSYSLSWRFVLALNVFVLKILCETFSTGWERVPFCFGNLLILNLLNLDSLYSFGRSFISEHHIIGWDIRCSFFKKFSKSAELCSCQTRRVRRSSISKILQFCWREVFQRSSCLKSTGSNHFHSVFLRWNGSAGTITGSNPPLDASSRSLKPRLLDRLKFEGWLSVICGLC